MSMYPGRESVRMGEGSIRGPPRRAVPTSIANGARLLTDRSRPTTPRSVAWKKPGSGNADQISHLTEEMDKLKKRLKKSKKRDKKRARDSSDSDSDSD